MSHFRGEPMESHKLWINLGHVRKSMGECFFVFNNYLLSGWNLNYGSFRQGRVMLEVWECEKTRTWTKQKVPDNAEAIFKSLVLFFFVSVFLSIGEIFSNHYGPCFYLQVVTSTLEDDNISGHPWRVIEPPLVDHGEVDDDTTPFNSAPHTPVGAIYTAETFRVRSVRASSFILGVQRQGQG